MSLQSLPIELGLNIVIFMAFLKEVDLLFASQHGPDGEKYLNLIIKRYRSIFKLLASLQKTVCKVEEIMSIRMERS